MKIRKYSSSILFWSMISAAFIGPGTVITALSAGKDFGANLIWTLVFATFACIVLQEAVARVTLISGKNIGQILREKYGKGFIPMTSVLVIVVGCIAYQAGNLTGAALPIITQLRVDIIVVVAVIAIVASIILSLNKISLIAKSLGIIVAVMGIGFILISFQSEVQISDILSGFIPSITPGSSLIVLGLIGTTIVPYNLFLGSGVAKDSSVHSMQVGIITAVIIGGLISLAILISGTILPDGSNIRNAGVLLGNKFGSSAAILFTIGLFSAGFTSSVTAPLAAAITVRSVLDKKSYEKATWMIVLAAGVTFAMIGGSPVPLIILAQAINGAFLPFIVFLIILIINDSNYFDKRNSKVSNIALLVVFLVTSVLGLLNILKALFRIAGENVSDSFLIPIFGIATLLTGLLAYRVLSQEGRP